MGFFSSNSDLKDEVRDLRSINKQLRAAEDKFNDRLERQSEEHADHVRDLERSHELEVRDLHDEHSDSLHRMDQEVDGRIESIRDNAAEDVKTAEAKVAAKDVEIATLKLQLKEKGEDVKLQIRAGQLDAREQSADEINDLNVKLAKAESSVAIAKAEGNAKDVVIKVLEKQLGISDDRASDQFETLVDKLPTVDMDSFQINVEVPAPVVVSQKGEQQKNK